MRKTTRHTTRIAALAVVPILALTGCGGGDEGDDAATGTGTGTEATGSAPSAEGSVSFDSPSDGDTVSSPVTLEMSAEGVTVEPADAGVNEGAGHLHVMVDTDCVPAGQAIPKDDSHVHFGDGSTTGELELEPGEHTLCLQLADGDHVATDITDEITITVE